MADTVTITLHVSPLAKQRADELFRSRGTTTAKALSGYFDEEFDDADDGSELTQAQKDDLIRRVARADRGKEVYDTKERLVSVRNEIYINELIRRTKDARERPEDTIPMKQAFAELRREFGITQ